MSVSGDISSTPLSLGSEESSVPSSRTYDGGAWDNSMDEDTASFSFPTPSAELSIIWGQNRMTYARPQAPSAPLNPRPLLQSLTGGPITIKLKFNATEYDGHLVSADGYMNLQLSDAEEWIDLRHTGHLGMVFIRCNNVLWLGRQVDRNLPHNNRALQPGAAAAAAAAAPVANGAPAAPAAAQATGGGDDQMEE